MALFSADVNAKRIAEEIRLASRKLDPSGFQTEISVPGIHCGGCISKIETMLAGLDGIDRARVNLSTRRLTLVGQSLGAIHLALQRLQALGYEWHLLDTGCDQSDGAFKSMLRALAVSGFAAMNIMMVSVGVWAGAEGTVRDLLHLIAGLIALPALIYSGRVFYLSAWRAISHGTTNMDVPISIGIVLAFGLSVYDTLTRASHAYFDAVTMLVFFLLIGRTLDHMMREKARTAVKGLARLAARGATVIDADGFEQYQPVESIKPGAIIRLMPGERVPVDARVIRGTSRIDTALITGESEATHVEPGTLLHAGTHNIGASLTIEAVATSGESFLAEMTRMMEAAEAGRGAYRTLADRVSSYYAPVVHLAALGAFVGWYISTGDLHLALTIAIAVLIITCPCALGLAVPMVHVVAARQLLANRIMLRDGTALERLADIDTVLFDKTGTLTSGLPSVANRDQIDEQALRIAGSLCALSSHPYSQAIAKAARDQGLPLRDDVEVIEHAGMGVEARIEGVLWQVGRAEWALETDLSTMLGTSGTVLTRDGALVAAFEFSDPLRSDAASTVTALKAMGMSVEIVSGDRAPIVERTALELGIERWSSEMFPGEKIERIGAHHAQGRRVLMVGDGLNDAPALVAADVSMAPSSAADVGRNAAGLVFLTGRLDSVVRAVSCARRADRLVRQNFAISILYNAIALPIALFGLVTPLVAAIAMSTSSVLVVANALRLVRPDQQHRVTK